MNFKDLLEEKKVIFFDGAMGTSLQPYLSSKIPPEMLNLISPEKVKEVHLSYIREGVDVVETNSFGANRLKLEKYNLGEKLQDINFQAVRIAKEISGSCFVGASIGPLGEFIQPWGQVTAHQALDLFKEQIAVLAEGGADLIVVETMMYLKEARLAIIAAKQVCDLPIVCQLTFNENGRTLTGTGAKAGLLTLNAVDIDVIGANCGTGPDKMLQVVETMNPCTDKPLIFQPNAGNPRLSQGETAFSVTPEEFSGWMREFVQKGARVIGGCCGTDYSHIRAMIEKTKDISPPKEKTVRGAILSSRTRVYPLGSKEHLKVGLNLTPELFSGTSWRDKLENVVIKAKETGFSFINLVIDDPHEGFQISSVVNLIQQNTDFPITLDVPLSLLKEALEEMEGKCCVFLSREEKEKLKIVKRWGMMPGFKIDVQREFDLDNKSRAAVKEAREVCIQPPDLVLNIRLPLKKEFIYFLKDTIQIIERVKSDTGTHVFIQITGSLKKFPQVHLLEGFFLGIASWHGIEGVILGDREASDAFSILKAGEILSGKDREGKDFVKFFGGKNAGI